MSNAKPSPGLLLLKKKQMLFLGFYCRTKLITGQVQKGVSLKKSSLLGVNVNTPLL